MGSRQSTDGQPANADVVVGEDHDGAGVRILGDLNEIPEQRPGLMLRAAIALTEGHDTWQGQTLPGEKLAEVGVGRDEDLFLLACCGQHLIVDMTGKVTFGDVDDVVPGICETWCQTRADALVEEEPHANPGDHLTRIVVCHQLGRASSSSPPGIRVLSCSCGSS